MLRALISPANGFPPEMYLSILKSLDPAPTALPFSPRPLWENPGPTSQLKSWKQFSDDLLAAVKAQGEGTAFLALGHSLGAQTLLTAVQKSQTHFRGLILLDPTLLSIGRSWFFRLLKGARAVGFHPKLPLIEGTRARRYQFESLEAARAHFLSKPVYSIWDRMLETYLQYGLFHNPETGLFELRWSREWEARIFETTPTEHWERLQSPVQN